MKLELERIELREIELPLKWPFETSFGRTTRRRIMIVRAFDKSGAYGYGECTAPEDPFYNHETIDTAWIIVSRYVGELLRAARIETADAINSALARIRGNRMAKGGVETAVWDLEARLMKRFDKKPDMEAILFLIGIQETGFLKEKITKEQKHIMLAGK